MSSRRIYITLNSEKEKDNIISNYLSLAYSESDFIKELLYQSAINSTLPVQIVTNNEKVQKGANSINKVRSGVNSTKKDMKDDKSKGDKKVQLDAGNTPKVLIGINNNVEIQKGNEGVNKVQDDIKNNELEQLKHFM